MTAGSRRTRCSTWSSRPAGVRRLPRLDPRGDLGSKAARPRGPGAASATMATASVPRRYAQTRGLLAAREYPGLQRIPDAIPGSKMADSAPCALSIGLRQVVAKVHAQA
jgi:hypothetical protein